MVHFSSADYIVAFVGLRGFRQHTEPCCVREPISHRPAGLGLVQFRRARNIVSVLDLLAGAGALEFCQSCGFPLRVLWLRGKRDIARLWFLLALIMGVRPPDALGVHSSRVRRRVLPKVGNPALLRSSQPIA